MTTTRINHRGHDHDNTKAARAICRAEMAKFRTQVLSDRADMSNAVGSPVSWIRPGTIVRCSGVYGMSSHAVYTITGFGTLPATANDDLAVYLVDSNGDDHEVTSRQLIDRVVF